MNKVKMLCIAQRQRLYIICVVCKYSIILLHFSPVGGERLRRRVISPPEVKDQSIGKKEPLFKYFSDGHAFLSQYYVCVLVPPRYLWRRFLSTEFNVQPVALTCDLRNTKASLC